MTTYTLANPTSVDSVTTWADAAATTTQIEALSVGNIGTGLYDDLLTYTLYTPGVTYYYKVTWTAGGTQRSQIIPFILFPQGQAAGSATVTGTDCDGAHIEAPVLSLRLGAGDFREAGFENATYAVRHRFLQHISLPVGRTAADVHLLVGSGRAGAPFAPTLIRVEGRHRDSEEKGHILPIDFPAQGGYRAHLLKPNAYLRRSRNFSNHLDIDRSRPGYKIERQMTQATATYMEHIGVESAGTQYQAFILDNDIYENDAADSTPDDIDTITNPYATAATKIPQQAHIRDVTILVGEEFRVLAVVGGAVLSKAALADASDPTLLIQNAQGSMTAVTTYVRIRTKDSDTDTESGPNQRTGTGGTVALTGTDRAIKVDLNTPGARVTHWQVQTATIVDTPAAYEIHYAPKVSVGGADAGDSAGWIPVATTTVYLDVDPTSFDRFAYRQVQGAVFYRHCNPPDNANMIVHYGGRAIYASATGTWMVMSEAANPEYFFSSPSLQHTGFNTLRGEGLSDSIVTPCTALAATNHSILYFQRSGINVITGSLILNTDENGNASIRGRDLRNDVLTQSSVGAISPSTCVVDQEVFFFSQDGPAVYSQGGVIKLDPMAIRADWNCRDADYEGRYVCGYSPRHDLVLFSIVDSNARITGTPNTTFAWSRPKRQWCTPWDLDVTSWTLDRYDTLTSDPLGTQLMFGGPYGSLCRFGYGHGDGEDGSDADAADLTSTSDTSTTATVSGKTWTTDEWRGKSLCLTDRTTGRRYYRTIKSNTGTVLTWEGSITNSGGGWTLNIGGYPQQVHVAISAPGTEFTLNDKISVQLQDQLGVES